MFIENPFGPQYGPLDLPEHTEVLTMREHPALSDPQAAVRHALLHPTARPGLDKIAAAKKQAKPDATAVIVVSDNTRPCRTRGRATSWCPSSRRCLTSALPMGI